MSYRTELLTWSKGDRMETFWKVFFKRQNCHTGWKIDLMTIFLNRSANKHGGYIGKGAYFEDRPKLPHGLHGIFVSRYAKVGKNCWIYQNVTIGENHGKAPQIGDDCLIGAGAVLVGDIKIGNRVKIGAGAVVRKDIPDDAVVVSEEPIIHIRKKHE